MPSRLWSTSRLPAAMIAAAALALGAPITALAQHPDTTHKTVAADNTKRNTDHKMTAQNQSNAAADRAITHEIRQALMHDAGLSGYAHNVKIITVRGTVTLKGPVRSADEKALIETKAKSVAGVIHVVNHLTIKPEKSGQ